MEERAGGIAEEKDAIACVMDHQHGVGQAWGRNARLPSSQNGSVGEME